VTALLAALCKAAITAAILVDLTKYRRQRSQPRTPRGTYATRRTPDQLFRLVREVAEAAASAWPNDCPDPLRIRQAVWNAARELVEPEYGRIPRANEVTRQLRKATQRKLPWSFWVQTAFADNDIDKVIAHLLAEPPRPPLTPGDITLAMLTIARRLGRSDFSAAEYDAERRAVFAQARVQERGEHPVRTALPSSEQIITACGSWEAGRALAGFPPRVAAGTRTALAPAQAIVVFYARQGYLPQHNELITYMGNEGIALAKITESWTVLIDRATAEIAALPQLPAPPPYGAREPEGDWMPIDLEIELPRKGTREYPLLVRVPAAREFRHWCAEKQLKPTNRRYREWHTTHADRPSLNALIRGTSLKALFALGDQPDWEVTVAKLDAAARDEQQRSQLETRRRTAATSPDAASVTQLLGVRGALSLREIATALEWGIYKARHVLPRLIDAGVIAHTEDRVDARNQRYTLPTPPPAETPVTSDLSEDNDAT
jgi:hypothetical protein